MALLGEMIKVHDTPTARTKVVSDYCFNRSLFQLRSYKDGDTQMSQGSKQNIQLDKAAAKKLRDALDEFIDQAF
ncbi:hypothetical protein ACSL9G_003027 [Vibrio fluvialis]